MELGRLIVQTAKKQTSLLLALLIFGCVSCSKTVNYSSHRIVEQSGSSVININTATVDALEKLPHIGRKTAESIIEFRDSNGPFRRVEHLMQIRGISEERFLELRPFIKTE